MTHLSMRNCAPLTLIGWLLACSGDEQVQKERERWEASQPRRYVVQTCTLGLDPPACVRAAVEDGEALATEERTLRLESTGSTQGQWVACFEPDTLDLDACDVVPVM